MTRLVLFAATVAMVAAILGMIMATTSMQTAVKAKIACDLPNHNGDRFPGHVENHKHGCPSGLQDDNTPGNSDHADHEDDN